MSTRPFRLRPPSTGGSLLRRTVQRELQFRFSRRVLVVEAGAGFGKTTSLAQAVEQNGLAPRGTDLWLACEPADIDGGHLTAGLRSTLGLDPEGPLEDVAVALSELAPVEVCLILDDIHELTPNSSGAEVLERLIADLPANAHVLLASRRAPTVSLARLEAQGHVHRIGESTLALTPEEISLLAEEAGVDASHFVGLGGWPALVSLALRSRGARDFVNEEVISWLSDDQRRALALVVVLGACDQRLLAELIGVSADAVLSGLPLLHEVDGWFVAHELWRDCLLDTLTGDEVREIQLRAVKVLLSWGEAQRAVDVCLLAKLDDLVGDALRAAILGVGGPSGPVLRRWLVELPGSTRSAPIGRFLAGLVKRADAPTAPLCIGLFNEAAEGFSSAGDGVGEVEALAQMAYVHHVLRDAASLGVVGGRLLQLAAKGEQAALPYAQIIGAFVQFSSGDPRAARESLNQIELGTLPPEFSAIADWLTAQALNILGYPTIDVAERCAASGLPIPGVAEVQQWARWHSGDIEFLMDETRWESGSGGDRDAFLRHLIRAAVATTVGCIEDAERDLAAAMLIASTDPSPAMRIPTGMLALAVGIEREPMQDPGPGLDELLGQFPLDKTNRFYYGAMRGTIARYRPELWTYWDDADGPLALRDRDIGFALGAIDRDSDLALVANLKWPAGSGELLVAAGLSGACLLVSAAWSLGRSEATDSANWLADAVGLPALRHLRLLVEHPSPEIATAAAQILEGIPVHPCEPVRIAFLGTPSLRHGERSADHPDWRRDNVRALLAYLIVAKDSTRDQAMAGLWPEADETSARRSIRSTLSLLHGVLEPERRRGEAPFFVRSDGPVLHLEAGSFLEVDVWEFDELLDRAEELIRDGLPGLAIQPLEQAIALYRGDLVVDLFHDFLAFERDRLRSRFLSGGSLLARLLLSVGEPEKAIAAATAVLDLDSWSESAHRTVMSAHFELGNTDAARRAARRCQDEFTELGGSVESETAELIERFGGR